MQKILEQIAATAELLGGEISPHAAAVMAMDLAQYREDIIIQALAMLRRDSKSKLTTKAVIEQIEKLQPDGRPGADEAWAMIPRDEYTTVVMTNEMAEAYGIARPLLDEGDQVAARMAFKEAYARIVDANKRIGATPKWFPSLGQDKEGREVALAEAVRLGRLSGDHACALLPPDRSIPLLESAGAPLAIEHKPVSKEVATENFAKLKAMLENKNG